MSQGFAFGFRNDDSADSDVEMAAEAEVEGEEGRVSALIDPQQHTFDELLATLPATISYAQHALDIHDGSTLQLPRRELFDIRAQAMTEADPSAATASEHAAGNLSLSAELAAGLSADDIVSGVYEGGFKTWECAADLARYAVCWVMRGMERGRDLHVVELGAGTALPSCAILSHLLSTRPASSGGSGSSGGRGGGSTVHFSIADYNPLVLRLATLPNLFLTALSALALLLPESDAAALDIEPSPALLAALRAELRARNTSMDLVSGAWGEKFVDTVRRPSDAVSSAQREKPQVLILASETIYAPSSLHSFAETLVKLLRNARAQESPAHAFVAAKRVYFGVGGGVLEFERVLEGLGGRLVEVWSSQGAGVGRCIVEVMLD